MEILKNSEDSVEIVLTSSDIESAIRQFICDCKEEYRINWHIDPKYSLGSIPFILTKEK